VSDAVVRVNFFYEEGAGGPNLPVVRDIWIERVTSRRSNYALFLAGFPESPVRNVHLRDCRFEGVVRPSVVHHVVGLTADGVAQDTNSSLSAETAREDS
jgi:hypothetical protein